jgi:hypothetical protein
MKPVTSVAFFLPNTHITHIIADLVVVDLP